MVVESQMRWRFSNDLLRFRASCFSLQDAVLTAVILFSLCGNSYKGEIFQEEYIHQKCFLYKKRILEISCRYNMLWGESEVAQSCPTLCDPMECSRPDSTVHGIFQARIQCCFRQRQIWFHHLGSFESKIKPRKWVLMESPRWPVQKYLLESQDGCHDTNVVPADRFKSQLLA